jgi:hypothetical protein
MTCGRRRPGSRHTVTTSPPTPGRQRLTGEEREADAYNPGAEGPAASRPEGHRASARLEGVVFEDGAGSQAMLKEETIMDVLVGWFAD